jgi:hypothetical protein
MQWHECNKQLFIYLNNFLEFYFHVKIRVLQRANYRCFFEPSRYRVVKIVWSCSEVV